MNIYTINNPYISENRLWLFLSVKEIKSQSSYGRSNSTESSVKSQSIGEYFKFIAPPELQEQIGHSWDTYESIGQRVAETGMKFNRTMHEGKQTVGALKQAASAGSISEGGEKLVSGLTGMPIKWNRIDSAITYVGSDRRKLNFATTLTAYNDPANEVLGIVKKLIQYSCPTQEEGSLVAVKPPYIFDISTKYGNNYVDLLHIKNAALTAVQPTYFGPYIDGYPCKCELTLAFTEIDPLFRKSIESGGISIIKTSDDSTATFATS